MEELSVKKYDKLIFVSRGDTVMGPIAEAILSSKYLLGELEVTSRGVVVLFPEPINTKAEAVLASKGLTMSSHMSAPLTKEDFGERTLFLTMTEELREDVMEAFPTANKELVRSLSEYVNEPWEPRNPYGGTLLDYGTCFEDLEALISKLVVQLNEEELLC